MRCILTFILLILFTSVYSQVKINSAVSKESRCANSGSLIINASGGTAPYTYSLIAPSKATRSGQSSNTFTALAAGSYTIKVEDNVGSKDTFKATVKGAFAQVSYTISSLKSHCNKPNGSAIFKITSGGRKPFSYSIYSGPTKKGWQNSDTIIGLLPGNYIGSVRDSCGNVRNTSFTITDKVTTVFSVKNTFLKYISCDTVSYQVSGNNGLAPYKLLVITGKDTLFIKKGTGNFSINLGTGKTYTLIGTDSCGTTKSETIDPSKNPRFFRMYHSAPIFKRCDSLTYSATGYYGISPYKYFVIAGQDTIYKFYGTGTKYFNIDKNKTYLVLGKDSCGNTDTFSIKPIKELRVTFQSSCGSNKAKLFPFINYRHIIKDSCMIYGMQEVSQSKINWQGDEEFNFTPNVNYNFYAKDTCCNVTYSKTAIFKKTTPKATLYKGIYTSYDSTSGIRIITSNFSGNISVLLKKAPYTRKDKFKPTNFHKKRTLLNYAYHIGDTIEGYINLYFSNLPKGKYEFIVFDTCGNTDTLSTEILTTDLWRPEYEFKAIQKCPSNHIIIFSKKSNIHSYGLGSIKKILPSNVILKSNLNFYKGDKSDTFFNNGAGTYVFEHSPLFYNSFVDSGKVYFRDTLVIKHPGFPIIEKAQTYGCSNKTSSIIITAKDGVQPYRFRIKKNGASTWSSYKSSNEYHGLIPGLYQIEISDTCGNATTAFSSSGVFTAPKVKIGYTCFKDSLLLFSNKINGVNYKWTKNDTVFSTSIDTAFKPFTKKNHGEYKLQVYLNTPQGVCVDTSVSIIIGDVIEIENTPVSDCDSTFLFDTWIKNSGIYRDTSSSVGGCDSVSKVRVYLGNKKYFNGDSTFCDSIFLFGKWYHSSQNLIDTITGNGLIIDTVEGADFENSLTGWNLNNTSISSGNANSKNNKVILNKTNDWIVLPPLDYPEMLSYYYRLSADINKYNKVLIQYFNGTNWINIEEQWHNTEIYEKLQTDLGPLKDSTNVMLRIKASLFQSSSIHSYIDDIYVTRMEMNCDTFINLNLIGSQTTYKKDSVNFCDSGLVNNKMYYTSQTVIDTLLSSYRCDSIITTKLNVFNTKRTFEKIAYCDSGLVQGRKYFKSSIIMDTLTSMHNCDSIIITDLTINSAQRNEIDFYYCDSGILNNKKYFVSQTVFDTLTTTNSNCDSIVKYNIKVYYTKRVNRDYTFCDSGQIDGKMYYSSQTFLDTIPLQNNCDSITLTNVHINNSESVYQKLIYCDSGLVHNKMYYSSQSRMDTLIGSLNCDSVVQTDLIINNSKLSSQNLTFCDSGRVHGKWYYFTQIVRDTLNTSSNCDSIVLTNITITNSIKDYHSYNFCDSGVVRGKKYYTSTFVIDTFQSANNCDSFVESNIVINQTKRINNSISVCDEINLNGTLYENSQIVIDTLLSALLCDSIITTDLVIRNSSTLILEDTFCKHYDYILQDGTVLTSGGVHRFNYKNSVDCDSIYQVNLFEADCPECTVFFPNAISINLDSRNEVFKGYGNCIYRKYSLKIYNRWGELLFETSDPEEGWDGTFNGNFVQQGVYLFQVRFINSEQKVGIYSGDLNVLR